MREEEEDRPSEMILAPFRSRGRLHRSCSANAAVVTACWMGFSSALFPEPSRHAICKFPGVFKVYDEILGIEIR